MLLDSGKELGMDSHFVSNALLDDTVIDRVGRVALSVSLTSCYHFS